MGLLLVIILIVPIDCQRGLGYTSDHSGCILMQIKVLSFPVNLNELVISLGSCNHIFLQVHCKQIQTFVLQLNHSEKALLNLAEVNLERKKLNAI